MGLWTNQILAVAIVALYLWDCLKPVSLQTRIVKLSFRGSQPQFTAFKFGNGLRTLINPFTPFFPIAATSEISKESAKAVFVQDARTPCYLVSQILTAVQLGLVGVVAPVSLLYMRDQWFLITVVLSYLNFGAISVLVWIEGGQLRLSSRRRSILLLEALICIPYSINLLRNLSLTQKLSVDVYGAFRTLHIKNQKRFARDMRQFLEELDNSDDAQVLHYIADAMNYVESIVDE